MELNNSKDRSLNKFDTDKVLKAAKDRYSDGYYFDALWELLFPESSWGKKPKGIYIDGKIYEY